MAKESNSPSAREKRIERMSEEVEVLRVAGDHFSLVAKDMENSAAKAALYQLLEINASLIRCIHILAEEVQLHH